ncbi:hypothetical protein DFH07DRAFT_835995 [Mycena maculata]|uniref:ABC transporter domain-containing protein n=1 Tax=Mycena maculata TaxID=230809 RepID=A0AAD7N2B5_9AGAR|nr:hypothetical protein DFH07DRAFT_835995 [Mycena maculata]
MHCQSSLTLALLRCIYTEGTVHYDGIPTASVNLDALHGEITALDVSGGQRQILALARAIVRDSKLFILDELQDDTVIQVSLRNELKPDVTIIASEAIYTLTPDPYVTVAHRLQTILDSDKIVGD